MHDEQVMTEFTECELEALRPMMKIGLLATVNGDGLPHVTLLSSLQANSAKQMIFGQFTEGLSKGYVRDNPRVGFLVMTLGKELWRGKADFTHSARQGPEFEMYNSTPMFRYNAYFGVHTVYFMDLVQQSGRQALPMGRVVAAALQTLVARTLCAGRSRQTVLNPWTRELMNKLDNLKFLAYVSADGYPEIVPVIQAQAADSERIIFSLGAFGAELGRVPANTTVAIFGMTLEMEDVLLRGEFLGFRRIGGVRCGEVRIDWVYSPMPPKPEQIYPGVVLEPVTTFQ
jgi:hypothetical protein